MRRPAACNELGDLSEMVSHQPFWSFRINFGETD